MLLYVMYNDVLIAIAIVKKFWTGVLFAILITGCSGGSICVCAQVPTYTAELNVGLELPIDNDRTNVKLHHNNTHN